MFIEIAWTGKRAGRIKITESLKLRLMLRLFIAVELKRVNEGRAASHSCRARNYHYVTSRVRFADLLRPMTHVVAELLLYNFVDQQKCRICHKLI